MKDYFAFQWHITDDCDQRCKHCYIFSENVQKKLDFMTLSQMKETLANCLDFCEIYDKLPYFYITGGDPILNPNFWELLHILHSKNIPFTLMGNPFHLNDAICKRLKSLGLEKYQMSLDGMQNTHDWFRKPGSFTTTLEKIKCINNAHIRSVIMTTVSGKNINEIIPLMETVAKANVSIYAFARYCPTSEEKDTGISPLEYKEFLAKCDKKIKELSSKGYTTYFNKKDHLWTLYEYESGTFKIPKDAEKDMIYEGCNCGNCHLTILPTGDVFACRRVQNSKVGNVFEDRLADLWVSEMERYRDYNKFKKCSKCELKSFCRGCPAVASGAHGDFYDIDPQCWKIIEDAV